jgi:hypothetical protein
LEVENANLAVFIDEEVAFAYLGLGEDELVIAEVHVRRFGGCWKPPESLIQVV